MRWQRWFPNGEWVVLAALLAEIAVFAAIAPRFASVANAVEILRLCVELGLLAVALTLGILCFAVVTSIMLVRTSRRLAETWNGEGVDAALVDHEVGERVRVLARDETLLLARPTLPAAPCHSHTCG